MELPSHTIDCVSYNNLDVCVAVVDTESDEIDAVFAEAIAEIEGKESFPCPHCTKICKSKGGLTKHKNSKHHNVTDIPSSATKSAEQETRLSEENLASIVEDIKGKLIKDDLFGPDINSAYLALFVAVSPIYHKFCRKKNQDKMLEDFYRLLPINPSTFLHCTDANVANLIMIEIPDRLVRFFKIARSQQASNNSSQEPARLKLIPLNVILFFISQDTSFQKCIKSPETKRTQPATNYKCWCVV